MCWRKESEGDGVSLKKEIKCQITRLTVASDLERERLKRGGGNEGDMQLVKKMLSD